jgi:uncharacterized protein YneF (UPF0154 family)
MNQELAKYGVYIGGSMIAADFILNLIMPNATSTLNFILVLILIVGLFLTMKHTRDYLMGGYISYGDSFKNGFITSILSSFVFLVYYYAMLKFNPATFEKMMEIFLQELANKGSSEEEMEVYMKLMGPGIFSFSMFFSNVLYGAIFSALLGFFIKRENPNSNPFEAIEE